MRSGGSSSGDWAGVECTELESYYGSHAETSTLTPHSLLDTKVMSGANNLNKFVLEAGPEDCIVKCRITRNCKGLDKGINILFSLFFFLSSRNISNLIKAAEQ